MVIVRNTDSKSRVQQLFEKANYYENYYSGCDCGIFIGPVWVDDIMSIQFTHQNNKTPIHGYMSESFDAVAKGTYIIQGQFAIAFSEADYLGNVLQKFTDYGGADYKDKNWFLDLNDSEDINNMSEENLMTATNGEGSRLIRPDQFNYIKKNYESIVGRGFDIYVTFGDITGKHRGGTAIMLSNVHITSRTIIAQTSGEPIAEIYSFFAQDIDENSKYKYALYPEAYEEYMDYYEELDRRADMAATMEEYDEFVSDTKTDEESALDIQYKATIDARDELYNAQKELKENNNEANRNNFDSQLSIFRIELDEYTGLYNDYDGTYYGPSPAEILQEVDY